MKQVNCVHRKATSGLSALLFVLLLALPQLSLALTANTLGDFENVTVMEVSGDYNALDSYGQPDMSARRTLAREFYRSHGDEYDFLVIFTNFDFLMPAPGAKAFFAPARNNVRGIGLDLSDYTYTYSSDGGYLDRLEGTIDMANISSHVLEPTDPEFENTLLTLSHEMLHRWGAYVQFMDDGAPSNAILGLGDAHWSFLLDSGGSTLYGNNWQDNGDGTFTSIQPEQGRDNQPLGRIFNPLDLYLMGLYNAAQVPPMTLIDSPEIDRNRIPQLGETITGTAKTITIDDIIDAEGVRVPSAADSRKEFRTAFIYAVNPGTWSESNPENLGELASINHLQTEWEKRFSILTDGAAIVHADLAVEGEDAEANPGVTTPTTNPAVAPSVNEGVTWLINNQLADGSWRDRPGTEQRDTATAVTALKNFAAGVSSAQNGQSWLSGMIADNHDFLSRKVVSLNGTDVAELLVSQNPDGGWGSLPGYLSSPVDTALALQGLVTAGLTDGAEVTAAVNSLLATQNPDGGWSAGSGSSLVQPTAHTLVALNTVRDSYVLDAAMNNGRAWLGSKQNLDGGFGNSPSTVYDTAVALVALKETGNSQPAADNAVAYLLSEQADSGSWNESSFQTALAVEALYLGQVVADLTVATTDISFSPLYTETVPVDVTVTANIHNLGSAAVTQVKVSLFDDDPAVGTLLDETLVDVSGNSSTPVALTAAITAMGLHPLTVVVDADDQIDEANEWNNSSAKTFVASTEPPTVGFKMAESSAFESSETVRLEVVLSYPWSEEISVDYWVDAASTASPPFGAGDFFQFDYSLAEGPLVFAPGVVAQNVDISMNYIGASVGPEIDETIILNLGPPSLGTLGLSQHTHTILEVDPPFIRITAPERQTTVDSKPLLEYTTAVNVVAVRLDGATINQVSGDTLGPLSDGAHSLEVEVEDSRGLSSMAAVDFTVDSSLPNIELSTVEIVYPAGGMIRDVTPTLFCNTGGPGQASVWLDDVLIDITIGGQLGPLAEGWHRLRVEVAYDNGQVGSDEAEFIVYTSAETAYQTAPGWPQHLEDIYAEYFDLNTWVSYGGLAVDPVGNAALSINVSEVAGTFRASLAALYDADGTLLTWTQPLDYDDGAYISASPKTSRALAANSAGNIFMAGDMNSNSSDGFVYGFHSTYAWGNSCGTLFTTLASDSAYAIAADKDDNIYVAGHTEGPLFDAANGTSNLWVAKLDNNCNLLETTQLTLSGNQRLDHEEAITFDHEGNVYLAGYTDAATFGTNQGGNDALVVKFTPDLVQVGPAIQFGTSGDDQAHDVAVDIYGNVYVVGLTEELGSVKNGFVYKYDSLGNYLDHIVVGSNEVLSVATEKDGSFYTVDSFGVIAKYTSDLDLLWTRTLGPNYRYKVIADGKGSLYAAGDGGSLSTSVSITKLSDSRVTGPAVAFDN